MADIALRLLGPVEAKIGDKRIESFPADKVVALLAYLAIESGIAHARTSLAVLLWPEHSSSKAQANLRQTLFRLRNTLEQHAPGLSDQLLTVTKRTIMLNPDHLWLDVDELLRASSSCQGAAPRQALESCRAAAELYRGEFMAGLTLKDAPDFDEWQTLVRERCYRNALSLLYALGERYAQEAMYEEMMRMARRQLALEPWREEAHRQLMLGFARSHRIPEALAQFETCRQILLHEWDAEPSEETVALFEAIRDRTLVSPELVVTTISPPADSGPRLHGFPQQSVDFIGRKRELNLILSHFAQQERRLMTVVGIGGMGRRRLAIEAARRMVHETGLFADGAHFVALDGASTPDEAASAIATTLRMSLDNSPALKQIVRKLERMDTLIVLVGVECVPDIQGVVNMLLSQTAKVRVLATSLFSMRLQGERTLVLAGMDCDGPDESPGDTASSLSDNDSRKTVAIDDLPAAVQMFVRFVREFRSDWVPHHDEIRSIQRICRLVDGMPIALSIAASWTRAMDLPAVASELESADLSQIMAGEDAWYRQRSVQAAYEVAWHHLPEAAKRTLAQVSVFQNGASVQSVYAVTQTDRQTLAVMVDRGLLRWQENGRIGMGLLLQRFASQKLRSMPDVEQSTRGRFTAHYLDMVRQAENLLRGVVLDEEWLQRIVAELDNIRQAWRWTVDYDGAGSAADILPWVCLCFERTGHYQDAMDMIGVCLHRTQQEGIGIDPGDADFPRLVALLHAEKGWFLWRLNRYDDAYGAVSRCLDLLPDTSPKSDLSFAHLTLGLIEDGRGRYADARDAYAQSLRICEADGDQVRTGRVLNFLGAVTRILGDFDGAVRLHEQSLAIGRHLSDRWGIASTLHNLGIALHALGRLERAHSLFNEAIRASASLGDTWAMHVAMISLADLEIDADMFDSAQSLLDASLSWAVSAGNLWGIALAKIVLGRFERITGRTEDAENTLSQALDIWRDVGDRRGMARTLYELGLAALTEQRFTTSAELLNRALDMALELEANALCSEVLAGHAILLAGSGQTEPAARIAAFLHGFGAASHRIRQEITPLLAGSPDRTTGEETPSPVEATDPVTLAEVAKLAKKASSHPLPIPSTK